LRQEWPVGVLLNRFEDERGIGCRVGRAMRAHRLKITGVGHDGGGLAQGIEQGRHKKIKNRANRRV